MTGTWWNSMEVRPRRMLFIWVMPSMPLSWQSSVISLQKCLWPTPNLSSLMPISCSASETPFTETWSTPSWKSAFWNDPTSSAKFVFKQLSQVLALNLTCRFFSFFFSSSIGRDYKRAFKAQKRLAGSSQVLLPFKECLTPSWPSPNWRKILKLV